MQMEHAQLQSATVQPAIISTLSRTVHNVSQLARPAVEERHLIAFLASLAISWSMVFAHKAATVTPTTATLQVPASFARV